ncbi:hypothetical protein OPQ81_001472 [Rhizoctonia solani]|nr:hypothetical protein OPQ81_001472 [Rhizoctonia solani]
MSEAKFNKAVEIVQNLPKDGPIKPTQDQQLTFYKYYKQGTIGDVNTLRPGVLDFTGKAKWDAWNSVKGTTKEDAWAKYVELLVQVLQDSDSEESKKWIQEIQSA